MNLATMLTRSFRQLRNNPLRTLLTLLGVVFGVGAVVAMMSIGEGAQREIIAQIEAMGATSVHVTAREVPETELSQVINDSVGLHRADVDAIHATLPDLVVRTAYRSTHDLGVTDLGVPAHEVKVFGVSPDFSRVQALRVRRGRGLGRVDHARGLRTAVIGHELARQAFGAQEPVGEIIRLEYAYFEVVGVLAPGRAAAVPEQGQASGGWLSGGDEAISQDSSGGDRGGGALAQDYGGAILIPYETMVQELKPAPAFHALDMISVQVPTTEQTLRGKVLLDRLLYKLHGGVRDYDIIAPEEILRQKQATQSVFNAVLISIAAISLLVGGIGVMNIMLATVMERISEIGLRRAIGARKRDILRQFLLESVAICFVGGALGVVLGFGGSWTVAKVAGLPMAFAWEAGILSFAISLIVGVTFGLMPAIRAANIDPIDALRGE